ncbi:cytochrome P450 6k1 [Papilio machaon]|uniref:cytochrome P450 6k1 n=1 Tax=Papilio machaon TaxID=76193 RepID=UPI001E66548C|nr:cytochrome P450 6k1 [Papilio machaon]
MLTTILVSVIALAVLWVFKQWQDTRNFWAKRHVPHSPPHPLLGSLTFMMKMNPGVWMRELYDRFRAPYVGVWWLWRPALVVQDPEIARRILVKDAHVFQDRYLSGGKRDIIGSMNLFTMKSPLWGSLRRRLTPVFTSAKLRSQQRHFIDKTQQLMQRIKMDMDKEKQVNLRMVYSDYTTDVVGETSFGVASDSTLSGRGPLRAVTLDFMEFSWWRGLAWASIFFYPDLIDIFGFTFFPKAATDYFRRVYGQIVQQRGGYAAPGEGGDLLDALRKIKQESDKNGEEIRDDVLVAQAAIFLQGGFDTTASAMAFATYELANLPHVQDKLYNEIIEIKHNIGEAELNMDKLQGAKYLECVIKEALRKYPPMGWLDRVSSVDYEIDDKLTIPAGTPVYVNAIGMHYDPLHFPEPHIFDPDRFLPENENNIKPFTYFPFGEGPRVCIGRRFAMQNMTHMLSNIVLNYKILPTSNGPPHTDIPIEKKGLFLFPGENLYVQFVPRDV